MNPRRLSPSRRRGTVIALALVAIMILLAMGVGLLSLGVNGRIYSVRTASDIAARCAADTGLTMALFEMNKNLDAKSLGEITLPQATNVKLPYSEQVFSYTVTGDLTGGYVVTSIGQSSQAERRVTATLALKGVFEHAIFTKGNLTLKSGTTIDAYNSTDPSDTDKNAPIRTESTLDSSIILNAGVTVNGNILIGAGGNPDTVIKDLGATTGYKYGAAPEQLPPITVPTTLGDKNTDISVHGGTVTITPADNGTYTAISLRKTKELGVLEISGGDVVLHVTGDIDLGQDCEIAVGDDSTLTLYVDGDIHSHESSGIGVKSNPEKATRLKLYGTAQDTQTFDIKAKSEWSGAVYAPNADINLYAGGDAYGSIVANSFEFKSGGNYHYDKALSNVSADDEGVRLVVQRWQEE